MAKVRTTFYCQNCGAQAAKWVGKCATCGEWNTYVEEVVQKEKKGKPSFSENGNGRATPQPIDQIQKVDEERIPLPDPELHLVLGGGLVAGSLVLFGGEPGIGKSTLMLQIALDSGRKVLYVSGEESVYQIKMRGERISKNNENCLLLAETSTDAIFHHLKEVDPDILIIDSIQTLHTSSLDSTPGSVSQIRECTAELQRFAKETNTPVFLIGHITKEGTLAGPKVLEHMVDTVLQFEGERNHVYRLLRATKNRFGSTNELGIYEMLGSGLRAVTNPSEVLITQGEEELSGIAIASTMEGLRPILIEVQALVSTAAYGTPQRSSTGFDLRRLNMLLAVLEKRCGFKLGAKDVFLNIAGGIKVDDPAIDLAVVCSVLSSNIDLVIDKKLTFAAEVGLSGEIRPVSRVELRVAEAAKLGYDKIVISKYNKGVPKDASIEIVQVGKIEEVFRLLFG